MATVVLRWGEVSRCGKFARTQAAIFFENPASFSDLTSEPSNRSLRCALYDRRLQNHSHLLKALRSLIRCRRALAAGFLWLAWLASAQAQGTGFTFQGRLTDGGAPANGLYDFQFTVRDALTAGNAVGTPLALNPVGVTNGLFTVTLDFGASPFNGTARWLEIGARTNGSASAYVVLAPRTPVSPVPYAMFANTEALAAQVAALMTQLAALSNHFTTNIPAGVPVVSANALDPVFLGQGLQLFQSVPAPAWGNGTATGVPSGRSGHSAVWTGQQLLVWGGNLGAGTYSAGGGAYAPGSDSWQTIASFEAPSARASHTAVWTGTEMVVWGGFGTSGYPAAGARYQPSQQTWTAVTTTGAPAGRDGQVAVWTGSRMLVWSGRNNVGLLADGGAYAPGTDAWTALPLAGAPEGRRGSTAVWTGTHMVVWGGQGLDAELASGGRLLCDAGGLPVAWLATSAAGAPSARLGHSAVWTGSRMLVWGGLQGSTYLGDGAAYDPVADVWTPLATALAPAARTAQVAVWTGSEMLIFGGEDGTGALASGAAYDPVKNLWRSLDTATGAVARSKGTAVWAGSELVLYGGVAAGSPLAQLQRLNPQPAWYLFRKP